MGEGGWGDRGGGDGFKGHVQYIAVCTVQYCLVIVMVITPYIPSTHSLLYVWLCVDLIVAGKGWGQGRDVCVRVRVGFTDRLTFTVSSNA